MRKFFTGKIMSLWRFYSFGVPSILVWITFVFLVYKSYFKFFTAGDFSPVLTLYFGIIASATALASVTFTFSKTKDGKDQELLVSIGELFLYASITLILALLISYLSFNAKRFLINYPVYTYCSYILTLIFSWGQLFLTLAANALHRALVDLEKYLFVRVREKIK